MVSTGVPIADDRGPGRRTHVHVATLAQPIVASRSEEAIRREMAAASAEEFTVEEMRTAVTDLLEDLATLSPVLRRVLRSEGGIDVRRWEDRFRKLMVQEETSSQQEDLFDSKE